MTNFKENMFNESTEQMREEASERFVKEKIEQTLYTVTVGDIKIEPWKLKGLLLKSPSPDIFRGNEISSSKERSLLIEQAIIATQAILKAYFKPDQTQYHKNLAGLCERASAITQELLAYTQVRVIQIYGIYHAQKTERDLDDLDNLFQQEGDYRHFWLYGSSTGIIPTSTDHARKDLIIIDPTRYQFHSHRPLITHPDEGKYELLSIPKLTKNDKFYKTNGWLWNELELEQWKNILNSLIK